MRTWLNRIDWTLIGVIAVLLVVFYIQPALIPVSILAVVAIIATVPVAISALRALIRFHLSIDLLASIALIASLAAHQWSSAAFINLMLASARVFSTYTDNRARRAIQSLLKLRPSVVNVKSADGQVKKVGIDAIQVGETVLIEAGERVPVDGVIVEGQASINQSSLTGESLPVNKKKGDLVLSSTLCESGSLQVTVQKVGNDTTLAKIIQMVEASQTEKAGIHTIADRFTTWYILIALAGSIAIYWYTQNLFFVLALLLVACADDIAVAIPLAFMASIGNAARRGIIIKGGQYLEALPRVTTLVMDKTGTLTTGSLHVQYVASTNGYSEQDVIRYAGSVECFSDHPAARAVVAYAADKHITCPVSDDVHEVPGKGITAMIDGKNIHAGKVEYIKDNGIEITADNLATVDAAEKHGLNVTLIAVGNQLAGFIGLADQLRLHVADSIAQLRRLGVAKFIILTGDNEVSAQRIARESGIDTFHANLLPQDKIQYVKSEINTKTKTAMVGDGVNDAAALALADVGIAMGAIGSDAAIEAADIALMKDDFSEIPAVIELAKRTMSITYQDFWLWGVVNAIGFWLVVIHVIGPSGAAAYNFVTDFIPFANSLRLFRK